LGKYYRTNQNIRYPEVRVIDEDNKQLGIMSTKEALERAVALGLDLVEITEKATPPIVKIIEFQKFKYQEDKRDRAGSSKGGQETKEIRLKPFMQENDLGKIPGKANHQERIWRKSNEPSHNKLGRSLNGG